MKLLDWLKRLGILSAGATAAVYTSAKDRPAEFANDGTFDAGPETAPDAAPGPAIALSDPASTDR